MNLIKNGQREDTETDDESFQQVITVSSVMLPSKGDEDESLNQAEFFLTNSPLKNCIFSDKMFEPSQYFPRDLHLVDNNHVYYGQLARLAKSKFLDKKRLSDIMSTTILYEIEPSPKDVVASSIETFSGFLVLLNFVSYHSFLIKRLFKGENVYMRGKIETQIFIEGQWTDITVDDKIPLFFPNYSNDDKKSPVMNPRSHHKSYGKSNLLSCYPLKNCAWVSIVQKAYSKAFSSYMKICGPIDPEKTIRDLTGCPVYRRSMVLGSSKQDISEIIKYSGQGYPIFLESTDLKQMSGFFMKIESFCG